MFVRLASSLSDWHKMTVVKKKCGRKPGPIYDMVGYKRDHFEIVRLADAGDIAALAKPSQLKDKAVIWIARCSCGKEFAITRSWAVRSDVKGCGCLRMRRHHPSKFDGMEPFEKSRRSLFNDLVYKAKHRDLEWNLTYDDFCMITARPCHYCGSPPHHVSTARCRRTSQKPATYVYTGIDRVDSGMGYIGGNCVPCCRTCNVAKNDMSTLEFYLWLNRVTGPRRDLLVEIDARFGWDYGAACSG